jgi:hypothetical protein
MTNAQQLIEQAREREERIATVWAARERCQQVIRLAEATTTVGKTPVGWCTKREAQHLMNAPSVGGSGGIFVGIGEFDFFPSWGTCGGDPVPTKVVPRAQFISELLEPLRQYVHKPHHYPDSVLELADVVETLVQLP